MNVYHHPSEALLLDYSSGALDEGWSIAIATHLALCPTCRQTVRDMEAIGAAFMENIKPTPLSDDSLSIFSTGLSIEPDQHEITVKSKLTRPSPILPEPLRRYVGGDIDQVTWQRLGLGAYQCLIPTSNDQTTVRLLRIPAGKPVPTHSHGGLELTLVLSGAFSDMTGHYGRGDLQEADETLEHQPYASEVEDCVCLAVTDLPLRFSSLAARMVQPFIGI